MNNCDGLRVSFLSETEIEPLSLGLEKPDVTRGIEIRRSSITQVPYSGRHPGFNSHGYSD
ncbi:hypothetical protein [Methylobacter sp.]|uniref:hypothetical protein n=1 Tax=Methylobacter sp. TaxID=2051955 RepID=UPI00248761E7|nr:hypothetical protein [Methylobacter sp.]MDI1277414.1 hypothetical protein [Methylobacter sp.]MDI1358021.1 hypothetical protein [Methylobacter sp.]